MVRNGIDRIKEYRSVLADKRLGLITSVSGVDCNLRSTIDILAEEYKLAVLFSPEHGVRGDVDAGGEVETYTDPYTGIPVYSLYRKDSKRLTEEMLDKVDAVVYDIQDIGARYYTFISTMYYAMQECDRYGKEFILLDRLNPLGDKVEGNLIEKRLESFIGAYPLCMRYGLTVGELAKMIYAEQNYKFPLTIIPIEGWDRNSLFSETGNIFVMPSLGIPRFDTALLYPGTCLFEGTNLSEGRGTSAPFEIIGAPYVDAYKFAAYMNNKKLPGVLFTPTYFIPNCSKYEKKNCQGVHIHVTDAHALNAAELGLILLCSFRECYPKDFDFLPPYKESGRKSIELLFGNSRILNSEVSLENLLEEYHKDSREFYERKKKFHLYE